MIEGKEKNIEKAKVQRNWSHYYRGEQMIKSAKEMFPYNHFAEEFDLAKAEEYPQGIYQRDYGHGLLNYELEIHHFPLPTPVRKTMEIDPNVVLEQQYLSRDFIVATRVLSEDEVKKLSPHCACPNCRPPKWWLFVEKLLLLFASTFTLFTTLSNYFFYQGRFPIFSFLPMCVVLLLYIFKPQVIKMISQIPRSLKYCACCYGCVKTDFPSSYYIDRAVKALKQEEEKIIPENKKEN
jgi:hypothetical protein